MKTQLKSLKKTSLAYILQIFAVIILFGYAIFSPKGQIRESINGDMITLKINKQILPGMNQDSLHNEKQIR